MTKVRRVDWSPDEWIAGTFALLTPLEMAVYMTVLMVIYSRGGEAPNDPAYIGRFFKSELPLNPSRQQVAAATMVIRRAIDRLIALGKLHPSTDGKLLTNGRADRELGKAQDRIKSSIKAGLFSGLKKANRDPTATQPRSKRSQFRNINDLTRTLVRNHQPPLRSSSSEKSTDAAREPSPELGAAQARAHTPKTAERLTDLAAKARAKLLKGEP